MKKFKFDLISKPHIIAKRYCSSKDKLSLDNEEDMKNFRLVMEIDDLKKMQGTNGLKIINQNLILSMMVLWTQV